MVNMRKAAIIGCGFVGATTAFSLMHQGLFTELVLIDVDQEKAQGEAMDLSHGRPYVDTAKIYAGSYDDIADCSLIIITAGANQKPNETRLDLVHKNVAILKNIIPEITKRGCEGLLLIVANPVDILTYAAYRLSGFPSNRVFGSGTVLDSARFRYLLSEHLTVTVSWLYGAVLMWQGFQSMIFVNFGDITSILMLWRLFINASKTAPMRSLIEKAPPTMGLPWRSDILQKVLSATKVPFFPSPVY